MSEGAGIWADASRASSARFYSVSASNCVEEILYWSGFLGRAADYGGFVGHDRRRGRRDFEPVRIVFYAEATAGSAPIVRGAPQEPCVSNRQYDSASVWASSLKSGVIPLGGKFLNKPPVI
jgi:hypothetical protein